MKKLKLYVLILTALSPILLLILAILDDTKLKNEIIIDTNTTITKIGLCYTDDGDYLCNFRLRNGKTIELDNSSTLSYEQVTFEKITLEVYNSKNIIKGYYKIDDIVRNNDYVVLHKMTPRNKNFDFYNIK